MLKVVETFSGIGAQSKALKNKNINHEIVNTAEWDINAILAYDLIHNGNLEPSKYDEMEKEELINKLSKFTLSLDGKKPSTIESIERQGIELLRRLCAAIDRTKNLGSVTDIKGENLPDDMNILTYSFPCQDLSAAGFWHGNKGGIDRNANNRSSMLWQIERILIERKEKKLSMPKFLLMENVRDIMSRKHIDNFLDWQQSLEKMGYISFPIKLNASNFGIPQKRVRVYMISVFTNNDQILENKIKNYFTENDLTQVEYIKNLDIKKTTVKDIMKVDYSIDKYKREADESQPNDTKSRQDILKKNGIIFDNGKYNIDIIPTLTTKQDRHPNSGVVIYSNGKENKSNFRYITPREGFMLMGFEESDFEILINNNFKNERSFNFFTRDKLNKMAGNSIVVNVLEEIFKQIDYINTNIMVDYDI